MLAIRVRSWHTFSRRSLGISNSDVTASPVLMCIEASPESSRRVYMLQAPRPGKLKFDFELNIDVFIKWWDG